MAEFSHRQYELVDGNKFVRDSSLPPPTLREEEDVMKEIARYVESYIVCVLGFVSIAVPGDDAPISTSVLASPGWINAEKLLLIIQNAPGSLMGIFSRSLCLDQGLSQGSMIPYLEKALECGFGVVILRPNTNSVIEEVPGEIPRKVPIKGSETPEIHTLCVWENIISKSEKVRHIALLGFANGSGLCKDIFLQETLRPADHGRSTTVQMTPTSSSSNSENDSTNPPSCLPTSCRIFAIATIEASVMLEDDDAIDAQTALQRLSINFEINNSTPFGQYIPSRSQKLGCLSLSLGSPSSSELVSVGQAVFLARDVIFQYFQYSWKDFVAASSRNIPNGNNSENMGPALQFSSDFARRSGLPLPIDPFSKTSTNNSTPPVVEASSSSPTPSRTTSISSEAATNQSAPGRIKLFRRLSTFMGFRSLEEEEELAGQGNNALENAANLKLSVQDFDLLKMVGKGAFGKVLLVRLKKNSMKRLSTRNPSNFSSSSSGRIYAMKVLKKSMIIEKNQVEHAKSERDILFEIRHPFIVRLRYAFQNEDKLYLVTDYYNGGTLFFHLRKAICFSESRAKFYAAELLLALDHLHSQHIIYRDLKLENVLLDHLGHVALTDFGLSKQDIDRTGGATTFCGTPDYVAPELLKGQKYGTSVDWWSFGVLLFEMINGQTPFFDKNRKAMFQKIVTTDAVIPSTFSSEASECLRGLLCRHPSRRLGCGARGNQEIRSCRFFSSINFEELYNKSIKPPFKPDVTNEYDTKYVPRFFLDIKPVDSIDDSSKNSNKNGNAKAHPNNGTAKPDFDAFTYTGGGATLNDTTTVFHSSSKHSSNNNP